MGSFLDWFQTGCPVVKILTQWWEHVELPCKELSFTSQAINDISSQEQSNRNGFSIPNWPSVDYSPSQYFDGNQAKEPKPLPTN